MVLFFDSINQYPDFMKRFKKFLKIFLISVFGIIILLIALGYIFRNKITSLVKNEINKNITAIVDFKDVNISFFRHFPSVSLGLDHLSVVETGSFKSDTLLSAKRLDATVNIISFIKGNNMQVNGLFLNSPRIHAIVNEDGSANWNIVRTDTTEQKSKSENKPFHLELTRYEISNGYVLYNDRESGMSAEIKNLTHSGNGNFNDKLFTLHTNTRADEVTFFYGLLPVLYKTKTGMDADLKIDNATDTYSFENLNILLNALKITGNGTLKTLADGYDMNIYFKTAETDFKDLISLLPAIYKNDFKDVIAKGTASFEGNIKGKYSNSSLPGFRVSLNVKNGSFKYADLPKSIDQININASVDNPDGNTDNTVLDISSGHFQIDNDPFDFRLLLKNPVTSRFVDAAAKGKIDLSKITGFAKLEKGTSLSGLLNSDISIKGNVADLEKKQYQNFHAAGNILLNNFKYISKEYPSGILINSLETNFNPSQIIIGKLIGEYLQTTFSGSGKINNLFNYVFAGKPLNANLTLNADKVNLNNWMGLNSGTTSSSAQQPVFKVPSNLDVTLNTKVNQLKYDKLDIENLTGSLTIHDQTINLNNIHGDALGGDMTINGSYSTKSSPAKPVISLNYKVNKVDIQKTFYAFNTVQKLMPIGKFLAGKLTSSLNAKGSMEDGMDIDLNTLTGAGNLFLIEGVLSKFAPLDKIASTLNVSQLQNISMRDVTAGFEFTDGKVLIKPFNLKTNGIDMEIGGLQGLDQSMDYTINMKLPRSMIGAKGNQLINNLVSSVSSKGIPVSVGETVSLKLGLRGTMTKPTVEVNLKQTGETLASQMKGQVQEFAQAKIDNAKAVAADSLKSVKQNLMNSAKEELQNQLLGKNKSDTSENKSPSNIKEEVKGSAKGLLKGLLGKKKKDSTAN